MCVATKVSAKRAVMPSKAEQKFSYADSVDPIRMWLAFRYGRRSPCFGRADIRASLLASLLPEHLNDEGHPDQRRSRGDSRGRRRGWAPARPDARAHNRP